MPDEHNDGSRLMEVRDMAMNALSEIRHHSDECDKRQIRIEKAQDDTRQQIIRVDAKVSSASAQIFQKLESTKEATEVKMNALSEKVGALTWKVAVIVGLLMAGKEGVVAMLHLP